MDPQVAGSTAAIDEKRNQSTHALFSPETNTSLKMSGDSNTLARPLPVASIAVPHWPQ